MVQRTWRTPIQRTAAATLHHLPVPWQKQRVGNQIGKLLSPRRAQDQDITMTRAGFKMMLDLGDVFQRSLYYAGVYEQGVSDLFARLLKPGAVVVDGGSNIGYFTLLAARLVGEGGAVHSFEPIPATFDALSQNIALNGFKHVHANRLALSDHAGDLEFEVPLDEATGRPLGWAATSVLMGRGPKLQVPAQALDDYADEMGIDRIAIAKLDLEGAELAAVHGMRRLLAEHRIGYLVAEVNAFLLDPLGIPRDALRQAMAEHGYRCYRVGEGAFGHARLRQITSPAASNRDAEYLFVSPELPQPNVRSGPR